MERRDIIIFYILSFIIGMVIFDSMITLILLFFWINTITFIDIIIIYIDISIIGGILGLIMGVNENIKNF